MMERTHYPWDFGELYFQMGRACKDVKSVVGSRYGFNISESHRKTRLGATGLSRHKGYSDLAVLFLQKCVPLGAPYHH